MSKKLTVSLVTFNGARMLPYCLRSIRGQTFQDFDLVIFDNHSSDETRLIVSNLYPEATYISSEKNLGFSAGHNMVITQSSSPYICVLNQDVILEDAYFFHCIQRLETSPELGAVQGKILRVKELTDTPHSDTIDTCGIAVYPFFHHFFSWGENAAQDRYTSEKRIFGVSGTIPLYRRRALEDCALSVEGKMEYFDEDFFMYKEDVDLSYRLRWRGWKILFVPFAYAYHIRTAKSEALFLNRTRPAQVNEWSYRNHFFVLIKNISTQMFVRYFFGIMLYEFLKAIYHGVHTPVSFIRAIQGVIKLRHRMMKKREIIFLKRKLTDAHMRQIMK